MLANRKLKINKNTYIHIRYYYLYTIYPYIDCIYQLGLWRTLKLYNYTTKHKTKHGKSVTIIMILVAID